MIAKPRIFISAVSRELKSARQLVANILTALGYEPVWQDVFGMEQGDLREMLRRQVDTCEGVVQLVGQCSGFGPPGPDETFGPVSYTQYEALYAHSQGKKVWYVLLDPAFTADAHESETPERQALQQGYRRQVQNSQQLFHPILSPDALEANVFKLRDELAHLRRRGKQWAALVIALLVVISLGVVWLMRGHSQTASEMDQLKKQNESFLQALRELPETLSQTAKAGHEEDESARLSRAYAALEEKLKLSKGSLEKELPKFAEQLLVRGDTSVMDRANALFATKKFAEAEAAALQAKDRALAAAGQPVKDAITALELAGQAALSQVHYTQALDHFRGAAALTSRERDPLEWARVQWGMAFVVMLDGRYREAENLYREVSKTYQQLDGPEHFNTITSRSNAAWCASLAGRYAEAVGELKETVAGLERVLGREHPNTLWCRYRLASALKALGQRDEAETEYRAILAERERVTQPDDLDNLWIRSELANLQWARGQHAEAEKEYRAILAVRQRELGPENLDTLWSRNEVAFALHDRGAYAEAEAEHRAILVARERLLGPENPTTLWSRSNMADALWALGRRTEAEQEYRKVLAARQKVLGEEHPDTLRSRGNVAFALKDQGKTAEARKEYEAMKAIRERTLGADHPETLESQYRLANILVDETKLPEAEKMHREVLAARVRVLGPEHADTLWSRHDLALVLTTQMKGAEAAAEHGAVLAIRERILGPEHPDTLKSRLGVYVSLSFQGKLVDAEKGLREVLVVQQRVLGAEHPDVTLTHGMLSLCLTFLGRFPEALEHMRLSEEGSARLWGPNDPRVRNLKSARKQVESMLKAAQGGARTEGNP